jgi:poly(3-hydroxybutyrate) depolymerase
MMTNQHLLQRQTLFRQVSAIASIRQDTPAHPTLTMAREGTPQNFALQKGGTKQYVATRNANPICKSLSYIG